MKAVGIFHYIMLTVERMLIRFRLGKMQKIQI